MTHYELLYIIPMKLAVDDLEPVYEKVRAIIRENGGTITKEELYRKQKLAYPINHVHQGYYILVEFDAEKENLTKINSSLNLTPEVLRHMVVVMPVRNEEEVKREKTILQKAAMELERRADPTFRPEDARGEARVEARQEAPVAASVPAPVEQAVAPKAPDAPVAPSVKGLDEALKPEAASAIEVEEVKPAESTPSQEGVAEKAPVQETAPEKSPVPEEKAEQPLTKKEKEEAKPDETKPLPKKAPKVSLEELDKKLDEILRNDNF